ncbi:MAG: RpiB/LacA/LacB family sugar-phosphate isomerase [Candidatus Vogelbacteria bacterium]|nr:RpiB/LacA/LacB family sugar-phosphate isomerase [Candidatus Vogelbacteria bacterium]
MKKKIYIASDHAGFELKNKLIDFLETGGFIIQDMGAFKYDDQDDYPDFISLAAMEVSKDPMESFGIVIGGSGQGEAIVANRFPNVRAAVYYGGNFELIKKCREHNDSNILSLGARFMSEKEATIAVKVWLDTPFSGDERHLRRIRKIDDLLVNQ